MIFFCGDVSCRSADATFDSDYYLTSISHQDGGLPKVRVSPTSALRRFCCRSPLKASANNDSLTLTRSAAGMGYDGSVGAGPRTAVLFVLP